MQPWTLIKKPRGGVYFEKRNHISMCDLISSLTSWCWVFQPVLTNVFSFHVWSLHHQARSHGGSSSLWSRCWCYEDLEAMFGAAYYSRHPAHHMLYMHVRTRIIKSFHKSLTSSVWLNVALCVPEIYSSSEQGRNWSPSPPPFVLNSRCLLFGCSVVI